MNQKFKNYNTKNVVSRETASCMTRARQSFRVNQEKVDLLQKARVMYEITSQGLNLKAIAEELETTSMSISRYISGQRKNPVMQQKIADLLGFPSWEELTKRSIA